MDKLSEKVPDNIALPSAVAEAVGISDNALRQQRYRGGGPRFIRVGSRVRYRWSDVEQWLDEHAVEPQETA